MNPGTCVCLPCSCSWAFQFPCLEMLPLQAQRTGERSDSGDENARFKLTSLTLLPWEHHFTLLGLCLLIWKMGIIILRISEGCEELNKMEGWKASQNLQNRTNLKSRDWNIQHQFINAPWKTADHHQVAFNQARPYSFTQVSSSRKASLVVHLDCKVLSPLSGHFLSTSLPQGLVQRVLHSEGLCALKPTTQASVVHAWLSHANR